MASSRQQWVRANSLETFHFLREPLVRRGARRNYTMQGEQCRVSPLIFYGNLLIDRVWQYGGRPNGRKMDGITFNWIISNVLRAGGRASTVLPVLEPGFCSNLPLPLFPVPRPFQIARFSARDSICTERTFLVSLDRDDHCQRVAAFSRSYRYIEYGRLNNANMSVRACVYVRVDKWKMQKLELQFIEYALYREMFRGCFE